MYDLQIEPPFCTSNDEFSDCGNKLISQIYFFSFIVIVSILILNLFIGIILILAVVTNTKLKRWAIK